MRKIWFRGKRNDNGDWVYGMPLFDWADCSIKCKNQHNGELFIFLGWNDSCHEYEEYDVNPESVLQYIGIIDKNRVEIFEGDIVRIIYNGEENVFVVVWDSSELDFKATNGKENYGSKGFQYLGCCDEIEVIGNIFDNPKFKSETHDLKEIVNRCKMVDTQPIIHAKWKDSVSNLGFNVCSSCYAVCEHKTNYCSHCGAKMDLEDENDD